MDMKCNPGFYVEEMIIERFVNFWRQYWIHRYCPVCCCKVDMFRPLADEYASNARKYGYQYFGQGETINVHEYSCPNCGASDRERLYALYLKRNDSKETGARPKLLHIAPEPALRDYIQRQGIFDYRTADSTMEDVDDQIDLTCMHQYQDGVYDCFICSHVLEHVADDGLAIAELFRILKPGGWGILMAPVNVHLAATVEDPSVTDEAERWRLFGQGDHVRLYAKHDFIERIRAPGFLVEQLDASFFGIRTFARTGITRKSVLYIVRKPL